jgi:hypothetical protein
MRGEAGVRLLVQVQLQGLFSSYKILIDYSTDALTWEKQKLAMEPFALGSPTEIQLLEYNNI